MTTSQSAVAAAGVVASLAYILNKATGFSQDVSTFRTQAATATNLKQHLTKLGEHPTLYRLLELSDPQADGLWFEGRSWSYAAMIDEVSHLCLAFQAAGITDGNYVAVFMSNTPEMVFTAYALAKLGAVPALVNAALRDDALLHCIRLSQAKFILSTPDIASVAYAAQLRIEKTDETSIRAIIVDLGFSHATSPAGQDTITRSTPTLNSATTTKLSPRDLSTPAVLIYTSGTTAPDTAKPRRYMPVRTYSPMPLFHGTTFFIGLCQSVGTSGCFCLARRFSVSNYWRDVVHARATRILYVGELCRILLATPAGPFDRRHVVEVACGNGMKSDVWTAFQTRFNIPEVREFYRSTEGLVKFDNRIRGMRASSRGVGKLGFRGFLAQQLEKDQFIVRFDHDTDAPYRDPTTGFCVLAGRGKPGEAIARIKDWPTYLNYHHNEAATEAKIIRNVFVKGDVFQKSGDLMVLETSGWVRFVDRVGDTFRWKGENVSAGEIREYLLELPQVADAIVTGKSLESYDGQAGVAVLIPETTTSTKSAQENMDTWIRGSLYSSLRAKGVPAYAFPRLVAVTEAIQMGDTFKHAKQFVNALDWTPNVSAEPGAQLRYWLCGDKYLPLQAEDWQAILEGKAKL